MATPTTPEQAKQLEERFANMSQREFVQTATKGMLKLEQYQKDLLDRLDELHKAGKPVRIVCFRRGYV